MRPPGPVPCTEPSGTPSWDASRRAIGVARARSFDGAGVAGAGVGSAPAAAAPLDAQPRDRSSERCGLALVDDDLLEHAV